MPTTPDCSSGADNASAPAASRLSAEQACAALTQRGGLTVSDLGVFWLEFDPDSGNNRLTTATAAGSRFVTHADFGFRSQVNGYGGGALCVGQDAVYGVEAVDQQIHRIDPDSGVTQPITRDPDACYGGLVWDYRRRRVLAVRESGGRQQLVSVDGGDEPRVLHQGEDFYGAPALSGSGARIAWVSWSLPDMPWVSSVLWTANFNCDGTLEQVECRPPPTKACVQQPVFDGETLQLLSDHDGWWQPWQVVFNDGREAWSRLDGTVADHASAPWQLGERHCLPLGQGGWVRVRYRSGRGELWLKPAGADSPVRLASHCADFRDLTVFGDHLYCIARSPSRLDCVLRVRLATGQVTALAGGEKPFNAAIVSPQFFGIPSGQETNADVSGFYYPPVEPPSAACPPPLILIAHGGPTSTAWPLFNAQVQFWCHHGFAVAEVNYRGSAGFGRRFRMALAGEWGRMDVEDMERAADYLAAGGRADGRRIFIQGRSSGGYTAMMAMIRSSRFRAGASLFGVSDPARLREVTHRFESGYLDWLLGSPEVRPDRWQARTPLHQVHRIRRPMIFFQGGQDRVVVPEQTRAMVRVLEQNGQAVELCWFEEEGHGFRQRHNQVAMLTKLLAFYRRNLCSADAPWQA